MPILSLYSSSPFWVDFADKSQAVQVGLSDRLFQSLRQVRLTLTLGGRAHLKLDARAMKISRNINLTCAEHALPLQSKTLRNILSSIQVGNTEAETGTCP